MRFSKFPVVSALCLGAMLLSTGCFKKKYENPITKDTLQPDKVLFDRAVNDIEHGRFEVARLTLNTLINTYDSSEYLAKAKLAIADSWYREGGAHGLAQAEAEYKDFRLFYPNMEESAEAQWRVCQIHYKQMEKVDRDSTQALRAEDECREMVNAYPNSKYTERGSQMLRNIQEVLADKEFRAGSFYHTKGSFPAAANRLNFVTSQYPLYSGADEALWQEADSFRRMGDRFDEQNAAALTKLVRDYPMSDHLDEAKDRLTAMKKPIPQGDPEAYKRMQYERDAFRKPSVMSRATEVLRRGPDTHMAAKSGAPAMSSVRPGTPVSVPAGVPDTSAAGASSGISDVTGQRVTDTTNLDTKQDARTGGATPAATDGSAGSAATGTPAAAAAAQQPPPSNHPAPEPKKKKKKSKASADAANSSASAPKTDTTPAAQPPK